MTDDTHDLQLTILFQLVEVRFLMPAFLSSYLEALVLKNALDRCVFSSRRELGLKDDPKRAVANNLALSILHFFRIPSNTILDFLTDHLCSLSVYPSMP